MSEDEITNDTFDTPTSEADCDTVANAVAMVGSGFSGHESSEFG